MNRWLSSGRPRDNKEKDRQRAIFDLGYYKSNVHNLAEWWVIVPIVMVAILANYTQHSLFYMPHALTANDEPQHAGSFIAERAHVDLRVLNNFGPRPTGSHANEVLAVDFLKREVAHIQKKAHANQKIYADVQRTSGAYYANFKPHGMTNVYRDVQNVVVKLVGREERQGTSNHTLMLNCHFDSVAGSPGASDDAASCCVMLETLRVLSREPEVQRHSVLFLFNGAEETPLQAAHGFITQHKWAKDIRAFLNLESVGSNGKELLFQSGPNHSWLIDMYHATAMHPSGHTIAEEIFQSGLIPSDTDFRIFRDFGHIPGMDFAHMMNGYRYHTKYDSVDFIPASVLQRTGDNILALVRRIVNSDELANTKLYANGRKVYFDVIGVFFVSYTEHIARIVDLAVALAAVVVPYYFLSGSTLGTHSARIRHEMLLGLAISCVAAASALALCYGIATELDYSGNSMVWYNDTTFTVWLYCVPTIAVFVAFHRLFGPTANNPLSLSLQVQARLNGINMLYAILSVLVTVSGYLSGYVLTVPLVISLTTHAVIGLTGNVNSIRRWLQLHLIGQVFILLWTTNFYHILTGALIPIAGRSGNTNNPDLMIAVVCCVMTIYITAYLTPLAGLLKSTSKFLTILVFAVILTRWGYISLTNTGFPYGATQSPDNPTPQRHMITHTIRSVYDINGRLTYSDSGFYFRLLDRNTHKTLESLNAPDIPIPQEENELCEKLPFCGLPFYSGRQLHTNGYWLPGPGPILKEEAKLTLLARTQLNAKQTKLDFMLTGKVLLSFQLRPKDSITLIDWDILDTGVPEPNVFQNKQAYFVMMTHGLDAQPKNVSLTFQHSAKHDGPLLDLSVVTYHWEYHSKHTSTFNQLLAKLPVWAFAVPSVASVQAWTF